MGTIPTPPTFTAGAVLTAAQLNSLATVENYWAAAPKVFAYQTGATTFATSGTYALVGLDTDLYNTDGPSSASLLHDTVTNNSRLVAQTAGKYRVNGQVTFGSNATGQRFVNVRKNSAGAIGGGTQIQTGFSPASGSGATPCAIAPTMVVLSVGDYLEMFGMQSSGGSLGSATGISGTIFTMELVAQ